jgi:hypothetical protein
MIGEALPETRIPRAAAKAPAFAVTLIKFGTVSGAAGTSALMATMPGPTIVTSLLIIFSILP